MNPVESVRPRRMEEGSSPENNEEGEAGLQVEKWGWDRGAGQFLIGCAIQYSRMFLKKINNNNNEKSTD